MPQVLQSKAAARDLDEIWDYIAIENHNPTAAMQLIDEFSGTYMQLSANPGMGQRVERLSPDIRRFPVRTNYIIFYEPIPDGILIVRVLHAARNITKDMFELNE